MSDREERIAKLLEKCKSNDIDAKLDAVTKLQNEFETGEQLTDIDGTITALKNCLRTSNQLLTMATLAALPSFFRILTPKSTSSSGTTSNHDIAVLRQATNAFLAQGGIIDRLGESRDKARENARESLVVLGEIVFKYGGPIQPSTGTLRGKEPSKAHEPPLSIYERQLRDLGFASRVTRVREQTVLVLVHLRRAVPTFPIRPYLTLLVDALEDNDGGVRDCARNSVIEIFTAPSVTDAARSDLKKELTKKNVRKTIVDAILGKLLAASSTSVTPMVEFPKEEAEATTPTVTASVRRPAASTSTAGPSSRTMSSAAVLERPASRAEGTDEVEPVFIASAKDLEHEFAQMLPHFEGKETEQNWQLRDKAITRIRGMLKGDVFSRYPDAFFQGMKAGMVEASLKTLVSLRTIVATNSCSLLVELVTTMGHAFDPFTEITLSSLFRMASFTKKIVAIQSQSTAKEILIHTSAQPRIVIPLLWNGIQEKNVQARQYMIGHVKTYLESQAFRARTAIESTGGLENIDKAIRKALADPNPGVREGGRQAFWAYEPLWQDKAHLIPNTLDANGRKQLENACPTGKTVLPTSSTVSAPESRKPSLAAAIAASRAKAKQIAADPPTLRHAATAHAAVNIQVLPKKPVSRPQSPTIHTSPSRSPARSASPSTISARRISATMSRSGSAPVLGASADTLSKSTMGAKSISPPTSPSHTAPSSFRILPNTTTTAQRTPVPRTPSFGKSTSSPARGSQLRSSMSARSLSPPAVSSPSMSANPRRTSMQTLPVQHLEQLKALPPSPVSSPRKGSISFPSGAPGSSEDDSLMKIVPPGSETGSNDSPPPNFSTPFEISQRKANTINSGLTPSTTPLKVPTLVVEDALRAKAEQAESAAQRLLEELEDTNDLQPSSIPPELLPSPNSFPKIPLQPSSSNSSTSLKPSTPPQSKPSSSKPITPEPVTPVSRRTALMKEAALFQDSPPEKKQSSVVDMLKENRALSGWWRKRMSLLPQTTSLQSREFQNTELKQYISALEGGNADVKVLKKLVLICNENPVVEDELPSPPLTPSRSHSPSPRSNNPGRQLHADIWENGRLFDELLAALVHFLKADQEEEIIEYGLIVVWEMLENQQTYLEGRESEILALLFKLRYSAKQNVSEATNTIRDALAARVDPVYGLQMMNTSLKHFLSSPAPSSASPETRSLAYAFGLLALGKFVLRLPSDILEEELPKMKTTLTDGLNNNNLVVRESAAACIIAAQLVLRDETRLFSLLEGLAPEKKNLLTYLFDKHGARGNVPGVSTNGNDPNGIDRLEKEMKRLDTRATPRA